MTKKQNSSIDPADLWRVEQVAEHLGCHPRTLGRRDRDFKGPPSLPGFRKPRLWWGPDVKRWWLEYIQEQRKAATLGE